MYAKPFKTSRKLANVNNVNNKNKNSTADLTYCSFFEEFPTKRNFVKKLLTLNPLES